MVILDETKIKRARRGELIGLICLAAAAAGVVFFAVCYPIARVQELSSLLLLTYILSPTLIALGAAGAAACNIKFGGSADRLIGQYVLDICLKNPKALHPERDSLTFFIELDGCVFSMHANGYKDGLTFDFSAFKRLSLARRAAISTEILNRLTITFCRLYERGAKYRDVNCTVKHGTKKSKTVPIIEGGVPDKKSFKTYLKNKH